MLKFNLKEWSLMCHGTLLYKKLSIMEGNLSAVAQLTLKISILR